MLRTHKSLSIVMTLCLCLALLAPVFVAPPAVQAATTYQALSVPTLQSNTAAQDLGIIQVDIDNCAAIKNGDVLTLSFPSELTLSNFGPISVSAARTAAATEIVVPVLAGGSANALSPATSFTSAVVSATRTTLDITFNGTFSAAGASNPGRLLIYFTGVTVGTFDNDITCQILGPASGAFPQYNLVVGRVSSAGGCVATVKSAKSFGTGGLPYNLLAVPPQTGTDTIIISEVAPGGLLKATDTSDNIIKLKLPNGFNWQAGAGGNGSWAWGFASIAANPASGWPAAPAIARSGSDPRVLEITIPRKLVAGTANAYCTTSATGSGQIRLQWGITVDDTLAKEGVVVAHLSDTGGRATEADIDVGKYVSYGAKVEQGTTPELIAGKHDQKLGTFYVSENVATSLLNNRNIKFILPSNVKWSGSYSSAGLPAATLKEGNAAIGAFSCASPYDTLKATVTAGTTKSKWEFKDFKVDIAPDFSGDLKINVAGDAGITGEVIVATVKPALELSGEDTKKVRIGQQGQELGTLILKETKKENAALNSANIDTWPSAAAIDVATSPGEINITLPNGATWGAGFPTVEVTDGDLVLKTDSMAKVGQTLSIPVKSESTKPSTIKISGMKVTLDRTVPEGEFKLTVAGDAINETGGANLAFPQFEANKVVVATCVTPAPNEGTPGAAAGQFKIGSNIYQVNGVSKIAGTAPYIKDGRTFVPVRYLGYALGVAEADVVWDEASQKVTLTKGDNVVELTIGSTTITVNGEAQTMEVAPEIANDYTMLPARYVAEGLGYEVGWDPGSQTVLLSSK
ncbi:copper amine oxidase N-terminal domain-containing protein [Syntrophomonas curvata]